MTSTILAAAAKEWSSEVSVDTVAPPFVGRFKLLGAQTSQVTVAVRSRVGTG